ncbi:MAG TPA: class I SAM-dependent methyltransferase [Gaiellaceae bacterium]|nr:class I SAM-dependent methyltransferase [Gaiellaceae bacterium]
MSRLEELSERYGEHHRARRGREFVFGGEERARLFRDLVGGPDRRVLDLGCRYGALTQAYRAGNRVTGVDVDREALAQAAELGIETHWADLDERFPFGDAAFDVVVAGELLEHVRDPQHIVGEARRVLCPGGRLIGSVPNAYRLKNRLRFLLGRAPESDPTHLHMFSPSEVRGLLRDFSDVELHLISSRFLRVHARLFANDIVFAGTKPR